MKPLFFIIISCGLVAGCTSNDAKGLVSVNDSAKKAGLPATPGDPANYTSIQWQDSLFQDLGKVEQGGVVEVSWHFKNSGSKPLIITNATASCGCTVAEKPEAPIPPGGEGIIKAKFDSHGREGAQRKDVYVTANTADKANHQLSFAIEVLKK